MINNEYKPMYFKYPIFQILYVILWLPFGFILSYVFSTITIKIVYFIMSAILKFIFSFSFEMFLFSGRMQALIPPFYFLITVVFYLILLVLGLELISYFLSKKKIAGGYNEQSNNK